MEIQEDEIKALCKLQATASFAISILDIGAGLDESVLNEVAASDRLREAVKETKDIALKYEAKLNLTQEIE